MGSPANSIAFGPGPLGFELEPVWQADGRATGCRVAGFKSLPDGTAGQAQRLGEARAGDVLTEINGVPVRDTSFDKIIALLRHDTSRAERRLTFQPGLSSPMTAPPPQSQDSVLKHAGLRSSNSGGSTQPTTPSPGSNPRPSVTAVRLEEPIDANLGEGQQQPQQQSRTGWAMRLMGVGGRGNEADATLQEEGCPNGGGVMISAQDGLGESSCNGGDHAAGDAVNANAELTSAGVDSAGGTESWEGRQSHGLAELLTRNRPSGRAAQGTESSVHGAKCGAVKLEQPGLPSPATVTESSLLNESAINSQQLLNGAIKPATFEGVAHDGDSSPESATQSPGKAWLKNGVVSSSPSRGRATNGHQQQWRRPGNARQATTKATTLQHGGGSGVPAADGGVLSTPRLGFDGGDKYGLYEGGFEVGSPDAADQSLDTVSLSASTDHHHHRREASARRHWMVSNLWGGGGEQAAAEGSTTAAATAATSEDSEVEEARRLARSLAAKVKERARRCEELEDFCSLRDDQVSMLQRESNSLASRASFLTEELSDMSALVDALQRDRSRLEEELAQRGPVESTRAGTGCESSAGEGAKAPIAGVASGTSLLGAEGNVVVDAAAAEDVTADGAATTVAAMAASVAAAETLATKLEASEAKARGDADAAEARCVALNDMVNSLLAEKMSWKEERAASAADALRLRARVSGLEEAVVECSGLDEDGGGADGGRNELLVGELRTLLRDRTRQLEVKTIGMERLAARVRELEEENKRLNASLSTREEDILVSDREMQALSVRLKAESQESREAAAGAQAVAEELRKALAVASTGSGVADETSGNTDGNSARSMADRVEWAEERARLQHNLMSLTEALKDREARAAMDEEAAESRLQMVREDRDRFAQEAVSLREAEASLRIELSEALSAAAASSAAKLGGVATPPGEGNYSQGGARLPSDSAEVAPAAKENESQGGDLLRLNSAEVVEGAPPTRGAAEMIKIESPARRGDDVTAAGGEDVGDCRGNSHAEEAEAPAAEGRGGAENEQGVESGKGGLEEGKGGVGAEGGSCPVARRMEGGGGEAVSESPQQQQQSVGVVRGSTAMVGHDQWFEGNCEGGIDGLQLDLMEKDIVIEQLRAQLKQARSRIAAMEEEQAADTAPLEGLLSQLGELKGSLQEREERELRCRDQVDVGLMRMEKLKEESAAAALASPPVSFAGSASVSPPFSRQAEPLQAQVEQQRSRRQIDDLHWELQTFKRRIEERETQLRDVREEANNLKKRCRDAERDLAASQSEAGVASAEASAERRRASTRSAELQSVRAELQFVKQRAATAAEEQRLQLLSDGRSRVAAAVKVAEAEWQERVDALTASLRAVTAARDELVEGSGRAARLSSDRAEDVAARTGQLEALRCSLAAREAELEAVIHATADFVHADGAKGAGLGGGGGGALRGALAAANAARRSGSVAAELREELLVLRGKASEGKLELDRLCAALQDAKTAEERAVAAAAKATATATAATAAAATAAAATAAADQRSLRLSQADSEKNGGEGGAGGRFMREEARDMDKRAQAAEEALRRALAGAEQAWRTISRCLQDECRANDDLSGDGALPALAPSLLPWNPTSDPCLDKLVTGAEALASACRRRGDGLRRATFAARAKEVCAREARRREATQTKARADAERRLEDALSALEECRQQQHQQAEWGSAAGVAGESGWASAVAVRGEERESEGRQGVARAFLTPAQEEHLRQIRNEVDRLEGHNETLRRSLVRGGDRLPVHNFGKAREGDVPAQRLLFPPQPFGRGRSSARWEHCQGVSDSDRASARTPSPATSWAAGSGAGGTPWSQRSTNEKAKLDDDHDGGGDDGGHTYGLDDARACVLKECAQYAPPLQGDGSGGTVVSGWATRA